MHEMNPAPVEVLGRLGKHVLQSDVGRAEQVYHCQYEWRDRIARLNTSEFGSWRS